MGFEIFSWGHFMFAVKATALTVFFMFVIMLVAQVMSKRYRKNGDAKNAENMESMASGIWGFVVAVGSFVEKLVEGKRK